MVECSTVLLFRSCFISYLFVNERESIIWNFRRSTLKWRGQSPTGVPRVLNPIPFSIAHDSAYMGGLVV